MNLYYQLSDGNMIPKYKVDDALNILQKIIGGGHIVDLTDDEVIHKGTKIDAIQAYRRKYDCGLVEAKATIEFLRGETEV